MAIATKRLSDKCNRAFGMIEILVVVFLVVVGILSVLNFTVSVLKITNLNKQVTQANNLAVEIAEATRTFRDGTDWFVDGLGVLNIDTAYRIQKTTDDPPQWQFVSGQETIDGFTRQIVLGRVFRDPVTGNIAETGIEDQKTKKATITVSWDDKSVVLITYLSNWQ